MSHASRRRARRRSRRRHPILRLIRAIVSVVAIIALGLIIVATVAGRISGGILGFGFFVLLVVAAIRKS
jgi:predicted anti-sigma-YlaC factor YlaD